MSRNVAIKQRAYSMAKNRDATVRWDLSALIAILSTFAWGNVCVVLFLKIIGFYER